MLRQPVQFKGTEIQKLQHGLSNPHENLNCVLNGIQFCASVRENQECQTTSHRWWLWWWHSVSAHTYTKLEHKRPTLIVSDSNGIEKLIVWMCCRCISLAASLYYYCRQSARWLALSVYTVIIMNCWRYSLQPALMFFLSSQCLYWYLV